MLAAGDGGEALTRLGERSDMQLVLTDIVMPRMNGRDLMTRVRATPAVPVLFMSGYAYDESMREDVALAEVRVLSKPVSREKLAEFVRRALNKVEHEAS